MMRNAETPQIQCRSCDYTVLFSSWREAGAFVATSDTGDGLGSWIWVLGRGMTCPVCWYAWTKTTKRGVK